MLRLKVSPSHLAYRVLLLLVAGSLLAACGPLGDDDKADPTATSESIQQPTTGSDEAPSTSVAAMPTVPDGTPEVTNTDLSTPVTDDAHVQTPETIAISTPLPEGGSTPAVSEATPFENEAIGTPVASDEAEDVSADAGSDDDTQFSDSDGTSGPVPGATQAPATSSEATPAPDSASDATPGDQPFFVEEEATPVPGATPDASASPVASDPGAALEDVQPVSVSSCDVADVPAIGIEQIDYVTNTDVNFRVGPGADCDAIGDGPIGEFSSVTLLGGPVVRDDADDDFVWVQVEIAGETGWIITEVLDPAT